MTSLTSCSQLTRTWCSPFQTWSFSRSLRKKQKTSPNLNLTYFLAIFQSLLRGAFWCLEHIFSVKNNLFCVFVKEKSLRLTTLCVDVGVAGGANSLNNKITYSTLHVINLFHGVFHQQRHSLRPWYRTCLGWIPYRTPTATWRTPLATRRPWTASQRKTAATWKT